MYLGTLYLQNSFLQSKISRIPSDRDYDFPMVFQRKTGVCVCVCVYFFLNFLVSEIEATK